MYRPLFILFAIAVIISSCKEQAPLKLIHEKKITKGITATWEGACTVNLQRSELPDTGYTIVITLKIPANYKHSAMPLEHIASNMALIAGKNLTQEEHWRGYNVKCIIEQYDAGKKKTNYEIRYDADRYRKTLWSESYFTYCTNQIRSRQLTALFGHMDTSVVSAETMNSQKNKIDTLCARFGKEYGHSLSDSLISFSYTTLPQKNHLNLEVLNYYGFIMYQRKAVIVSVSILPEKQFADKFLYGMTIGQ